MPAPPPSPPEGEGLAGQRQRRRRNDEAPSASRHRPAARAARRPSQARRTSVGRLDDDHDSTAATTCRQIPKRVNPASSSAENPRSGATTESVAWAMRSCPSASRRARSRPASAAVAGSARSSSGVDSSFDAACGRSAVRAARRGRRRSPRTASPTAAGRRCRASAPAVEHHQLGPGVGAHQQRALRGVGGAAARRRGRPTGRCRATRPRG